jgi:hypothetical protein
VRHPLLSTCGIAFGALGGSCDPTYLLCVSVTSCSDESPLGGVRFRVTSGRHHIDTFETESDGGLCFADIGDGPPCPLTVRYEKAGFETKVQELRDLKSGTLPPVCLEPCARSAAPSVDAGGADACVAADVGSTDAGARD